MHHDVCLSLIFVYSNVRKIIKVLYSGNDFCASESPGDQLFQGTLLELEQNIEAVTSRSFNDRKKRLFRFDNQIEDKVTEEIERKRCNC